MKIFGIKIRDGILAMVSANLLNVFKKSEYEDDGIKFQWGDRYIMADEVVTGVGGKYWRENEDGSITEFLPTALQFECVKSNIINILNKEDFIYNDKDFTIEFKNEKEAIKATKEFNTLFWIKHKVSAERFGKKVQLYITKEVLETTYSPDCHFR